MVRKSEVSKYCRTSKRRQEVDASRGPEQKRSVSGGGWPRSGIPAYDLNNVINKAPSGGILVCTSTKYNRRSNKMHADKQNDD